MTTPRLPFARSLLNDPAFSDDPRSHPHFHVPLDAPARPRRGMRALLRRLTALDRIDELDESDPFGGPHHHDGPYEAIPTTRAGKHQPASRVPPTLHEMGLSLHLEPGQILPQNTVYTSCASRIAWPTTPWRHQPETGAPHSLRPPQRNSSLRSSQPPPSPPAPQERDKPHTAPICPPSRYESRISHQPPPSRKAQYIANPPDHHRGARSLDMSHAQSQFPSNIHLELPRIRHLPKHLVMPAPLQPQHNSPPPSTAPSDDGRHALNDSHSQRKFPSFIHKPSLLRKKSSAFPTKTSLPDHVSLPRDDATPIRGNSPSKPPNEAQGTLQRTRRRRLSKRKDDI